MAKRERRTFTEEFKQQIVQLYQNGKPRKEIIREYDLTPSSLDKWVGQSQTSGSFKEKDNLTDEQKELAANGWRVMDSYGEGEVCIMIYQKYLH